MKNQKLMGIVILFCCFIFMAMTTIDWEVPAKYKDMTNPQAGVEDDDEIGADLFATHCASCHGKEGYGDGKKAATLDTEMRDFSSEEVQAQTDGALYYKSIIGKDEMPNFEKKISDVEERWLLINYLRTLGE